MAKPEPQKFNWLPLGLLALLILVFGGLFLLRQNNPGKRRDVANATADDAESKRRNQAKNTNITGTDSGKSRRDSNSRMGDSNTSDSTSIDASETSSPPERTTEDPM